MGGDVARYLAGVCGKTFRPVAFNGGAVMRFSPGPPLPGHPTPPPDPAERLGRPGPSGGIPPARRGRTIRPVYDPAGRSSQGLGRTGPELGYLLVSPPNHSRRTLLFPYRRPAIDVHQLVHCHDANQARVGLGLDVLQHTAGRVQVQGAAVQQAVVVQH